MMTEKTPPPVEPPPVKKPDKDDKLDQQMIRIALSNRWLKPYLV